ncbi:MAG: GNAT family N-acetyltransferase [Anaerolineae bacterium]|nr:GNAT family N-acetyltransferase [Anaerolineae bacterium]
MGEIRLSGYTPGALGRIVELHGSYYHANWDLDLYFEAKVAIELAEFLSRFDPQRDGAWFAYAGQQAIGGIFIDGKDAEGAGARLRWFIVDPAYQGDGVGKRLIEAAVNFCEERGFRRVYLTTFAGLDSARHLYEKHGFRVCGKMDATELTGDPSKVELVMEWFPSPQPD